MALSKRVGHVSLYAVANLLRNVTSVALLPVYTHYLAPGAYGILELIGLMMGWAGGLFGLQLGESVFRFFARSEDAAQRGTVISSALVLAFAMNCLAAGVIIAVATLLGRAFLHDPHAGFLIRLAAFSLIAEGCASIPLTHMRADGRIKAFFAISVLRLAVQIILNVGSLVILGWGVSGIIVSNLIASILMAAAALPYSVRRMSAHISWPTVHSMLRFNAPLGVANVINIYAVSADRFFLTRMASLREVGLYSLAGRLAQALVILVYQPFLQAWDAEKYQRVTTASAAPTYGSVFTLMNYALLAFALALALLAPEIVHTLAAPQFAGAARVVPLLVAAQVISADTEFVRVGTMAAGRTMMVLLTAAGAVTVITPALAFLIPRFGIQGAAAAMLGGGLVRLFLEQRVARRSMKVELPWSRVWLMFALATSCWAAARYATASVGLGYGLVIKCGLLALFLLIPWWSPLLGAEERRITRILAAGAWVAVRGSGQPQPLP